MKILVTGGTGFLGRHVVWRLAAEGHDVVFTGRRSSAADEVRSHSATPVSWLQVEHGAPSAGAALTAAARQAGAVVHCAALSSPWGSPEHFHRANVLGTQEVLQACAAAGVPRLVHVSTPSLYFDFTDRLDIAEDTPLPPPVNDYARTKGLAEALVKASPVAEKVILRPRALFGPWDMTLLPRLLRAMERGPLPLMRGGNALLDVTYIDNAVDAICLALHKPLPQPLCIYNVSNGAPLRFAELLALLAEHFAIALHTRRLPWPAVKMLAHACELKARLEGGREPRITRYSAGVLAFSQTLSLAAIRRDFGFTPRVTVVDGISRHAEWHRARHGVSA